MKKTVKLKKSYYLILSLFLLMPLVTNAYCEIPNPQAPWTIGGIIFYVASSFIGIIFALSIVCFPIGIILYGFLRNDKRAKEKQINMSVYLTIISFHLLIILTLTPYLSSLINIDFPGCYSHSMTTIRGINVTFTYLVTHLIIGFPFLISAMISIGHYRHKKNLTPMIILITIMIILFFFWLTPKFF